MEHTRYWISGFSKEVNLEDTLVKQYVSKVSDGHVSKSRSKGEFFNIVADRDRNVCNDTYEKTVTESLRMTLSVIEKTQKRFLIFFEGIGYDYNLVGMESFEWENDQSNEPEGWLWECPAILKEQKDEVTFGVRRSEMIMIYRWTRECGMQIVCVCPNC